MFSVLRVPKVTVDGASTVRPAASRQYNLRDDILMRMLRAYLKKPVPAWPSPGWPLFPGFAAIARSTAGSGPWHVRPEIAARL